LRRSTVIVQCAARRKALRFDRARGCEPPISRFVAGEDLLTFYESSPGNRRGFCRICGSPILTKFDSDHTVLSLPLGTLDDDPGIRPQLHVYVASKAPWFTISDDLPQFPELPR
jgi:hypothetical protein